MSEQTAPSIFRRQPHYSFMRPGDFLVFLFLVAFTVFRFHSALTLELSSKQQADWYGSAALQLVMTLLYARLRITRRHLCDDSGEILLAVLVPQGFSIAFREFTADGSPMGWPLVLGNLFLIPYFFYRVWKAPQTARELAAKEDACETRDFTEQGGL
jgi:hypothetical protein